LLRSDIVAQKLADICMLAVMYVSCLQPLQPILSLITWVLRKLVW